MVNELFLTCALMLPLANFKSNAQQNIIMSHLVAPAESREKLLFTGQRFPDLPGIEVYRLGAKQALDVPLLLLGAPPGMARKNIHGPFPKHFFHAVVTYFDLSDNALKDSWVIFSMDWILKPGGLLVVPPSKLIDSILRGTGYIRLEVPISLSVYKKTLGNKRSPPNGIDSLLAAA